MRLLKHHIRWIPLIGVIPLVGSMAVVRMDDSEPIDIETIDDGRSVRDALGFGPSDVLTALTGKEAHEEIVA